MLAHKCVRLPQPSWWQNFRMGWFGWHLWSSSLLKPLLKQAHLQPVAQSRVQLSFECPQGCSPSSSAGAPIPSSSSWTFTALARLSPCLSCFEEPVTARSSAGVASPVQSGVEGSPPQTSCQCPYRWSPRAVCFLCHEGTLLPHGQLDVPQDPHSFFAELLSMYLAPAFAGSWFHMPSRGCHSRFGSRIKTLAK